LKNYKELSPIVPHHQVFDQVELRIKEHFKKLIYLPVLKLASLPGAVIENSQESDYQDLVKALSSGGLTFNRGQFSGKFNARTSRALRQLGARWDAKTSSFKLLTSKVPQDLEQIIQTSGAAFAQKLSSIDQRLAQILSAETEKTVRFEDLFDKTIFQVDKEFKQNVRGLAMVPELTEPAARKISKEWQTNLDLWIKNFKAEEIPKLRAKVRASAEAGNRYGSLTKMIQDSYEVSANKAKFLARQETKLLTTKFQETRYLEAGVPDYKWQTVVGTPAHPVRPSHKKLEGTFQRWDRPPVTTEPGEPERRNNPGQDYGCRCYPIPIVRF